MHRLPRDMHKLHGSINLLIKSHRQKMNCHYMPTKWLKPFNNKAKPLDWQWYNKIASDS